MRDDRRCVTCLRDVTSLLQVPRSEISGGTFKRACVTYKIADGRCGPANLCVCMYCWGCPFMGWEMMPCVTSEERGDCYLGCSGSSMFMLRVKNKDLVIPSTPFLRLCLLGAPRVHLEGERAARGLAGANFWYVRNSLMCTLRYFLLAF